MHTCYDNDYGGGGGGVEAILKVGKHGIHDHKSVYLTLVRCTCYITLNFLLLHSLGVEDPLQVLIQSSSGDSFQECSTALRPCDYQTDPS